MKAAVVAVVVATLALLVSLGHLAFDLFVWVRSGGHLRIRLKLVKHNFDPMQHRLVLTVTNVGRGQVKIKELGIRQQIQQQPAAGLRMSLVPTGDPLPRTLEQQGAPLVAEVSMPALVERWEPDKSLTLKGWAVLEDGRRRQSFFQSVSVKTPRE